MELDTEEDGGIVAGGETKTWEFYIVPDNDERLEFILTMADGTTHTIGDGGELNVIPEVGKSYQITLKFDNTGESPTIEEGVMEIYTSKELIEAFRGDYADRVNKYILMEDIDLSEKGLRAPSEILSSPDSGPITFDGNENTISNFNIKGDGPFAGLFNIVALGNVVRNLTLQNFSVDNTYSSNDGEMAMASGGIAGMAEEAIIENCHVKDFKEISATHTESSLYVVAAGGIVGFANYAKIYGCTVMGATTRENFNSTDYGRIHAIGTEGDMAERHVGIGAGGIVMNLALSGDPNLPWELTPGYSADNYDGDGPYYFPYRLVE